MSFSPNYMLASSAGYKFNIANNGKNLYDTAAIHNKEDFKDVLVTRPGVPTDLFKLHTHALVTVDGYIHPTKIVGDDVFILEAVPTLLRTKRNHIGILSFLNNDKPLNKITLTDKMIFKPDEYELFQKTIIKLPSRVDGVMFVFAGYIVTEDDRILKRISDTSFEFYPERLNYIDKIYELNNYRDIFEELNIDTSNVNDSLVNYKDITSGDTIIKLLTRFNTFFVEFKGKKVSYQFNQLELTSIPNNFRYFKKPQSPLIGGRGKVIEYKFKQFNDVKYTLLTCDAFYNNLLKSYKPTYALEMTSKIRRITDTYRLSSVYFMTIVLDKL